MDLALASKKIVGQIGAGGLGERKNERGEGKVERGKAGWRADKGWYREEGLRRGLKRFVDFKDRFPF